MPDRNLLQSTPPTGRKRALALWLSWLAYASYYLGRKGFSITKAKVAHELGLSEPMLAAIDTAFLSAYALGQVPSGIAADRIGARRLIGFGMLGSAIACAAFGAATGGYVAIACFALNGLAQATGWPGTTKVVADWTEPHERGRVLGVWSTCYQVGGIAASALATWLLAHFGWRAAFNVPAVWLGALALVLLWLLPTRARSGPDARADAPVADAPVVAHATRLRVLHGARALLADPIVYGYGACYFFLKLIRYSLLFWLPYYLHTSAGFDEVTSGYLSTSFEIGGVFGTIALGFASDRSRRPRAFTAALSIVALSLALLVYARLGSAGVAAHFTAMALIGALLFGPDALLSGAAAQEAGGAAAGATAVGLVNAMGSLGALLQGALTVGVQRALGWNALFYVFVGFSLLAALCLVPSVRASSSAHASRA